eukprot:Sdes_comp17202_c0_seq4m6384
MSLFDEPLLLFSSLLAWYLVFFSPADITMKFCSLLPIKIFLTMVWELRRVRLMILGIEVAKRAFHSPIALILCGVAYSGFGSACLRNFIDYLMKGSQKSNEFLNMSFAYRLSFFTAAIYQFFFQNLSDLHQSQFVITSVIIFSIYSISVIFWGTWDPSAPFFSFLKLLLFQQPSEIKPLSKKLKSKGE